MYLHNRVLEKEWILCLSSYIVYHYNNKSSVCTYIFINIIVLEWMDGWMDIVYSYTVLTECES